MAGMNSITVDQAVELIFNGRAEELESEKEQYQEWPFDEIKQKIESITFPIIDFLGAGAEIQSSLTAKAQLSLLKKELKQSKTALDISGYIVNLNEKIADQSQLISDHRVDRLQNGYRDILTHIKGYMYFDRIAHYIGLKLLLNYDFDRVSRLIEEVNDLELKAQLLLGCARKLCIKEEFEKAAAVIESEAIASFKQHYSDDECTLKLKQQIASDYAKRGLYQKAIDYVNSEQLISNKIEILGSIERVLSDLDGADGCFLQSVRDELQQLY